MAWGPGELDFVSVVYSFHILGGDFIYSIGQGISNLLKVTRYRTPLNTRAQAPIPYRRRLA
jgi:hypothetical protein